MAVQLGRKDLLRPLAANHDAVAFEIPLRVAAGTGAPRLLGPAAQGPPTARFVYVSSGLHAGQAGSPWDRRAKVPLSGITRALIREHLATPGSRLEVRIPGTSRDGGPICASVPLGPGAWRVHVYQG